MKKNNFILLSISLFLLTFLNSCRPDPKQDIVVGESKDEFDINDQIIIGDALVDIISDPSNGFELLDKVDYQETYTHLNAMIAQITNTASVERRLDLDWKVSILKNDEEENAFITPSGHLFIYTGLLKFFEGEHELVGMIAHEVAYADSDLLINRLRDEFGSKKLSKILSNDPEKHGILLKMADDLKDVEYSATDIKAADEFCTNIICEFVWDGDGLISILKRGNQAPRTIDWLQSKPVTAERNAHLTSLVYDRIEYCGTPDSIFQQRYLDKILNKLP